MAVAVSGKVTSSACGYPISIRFHANSASSPCDAVIASDSVSSSTDTYSVSLVGLRTYKVSICNVSQCDWASPGSLQVPIASGVLSGKNFTNPWTNPVTCS